MKTRVGWLGLMVSVWFGLPFGDARGDDHGNTMGTATAFPLGSIVAGTLETADDVDYFETTWSPPPSPYYGIAVFPGNANVKAVMQWDHPGYPTESDNLYCFLHRSSLIGRNETLYFKISYRSGSGGDGYHMASVVVPETATPIGDLVEYTLSPDAPVDARLYSLDAGLYAVGVCPMED